VKLNKEQNPYLSGLKIR